MSSRVAKPGGTARFKPVRPQPKKTQSSAESPAISSTASDTASPAPSLPARGQATASSSTTDLPNTLERERAHDSSSAVASQPVPSSLSLSKTTSIPLPSSDPLPENSTATTLPSITTNVDGLGALDTEQPRTTKGNTFTVGSLQSLESLGQPDSVGTARSASQHALPRLVKSSLPAYAETSVTGGRASTSADDIEQHTPIISTSTSTTKRTRRSDPHLYDTKANTGQDQTSSQAPNLHPNTASVEANLHNAVLGVPDSGTVAETRPDVAAVASREGSTSGFMLPPLPAQDGEGCDDTVTPAGTLFSDSVIDPALTEPEVDNENTSEGPSKKRVRKRTKGSDASLKTTKNKKGKHAEKESGKENNQPDTAAAPKRGRGRPKKSQGGSLQQGLGTAPGEGSITTTSVAPVQTSKEGQVPAGQPWLISKPKQTYALSTAAIMAAMAPSTSPQTQVPDNRQVTSDTTNTASPRGLEPIEQTDEALAEHQDGDIEEESPDTLNQAMHDDPLAPIDPTTVTMRSLVKDDGRGRVSGFMLRKIEQVRTKKSKLKAIRERMKMKYALEQEGLDSVTISQRLAEVEEGSPHSAQLEPQIAEVANGIEAAEQDSEGQASVLQNTGEDGLYETQYAPQMRLINGELVVDEESTQIVRQQAMHDYEVVEDHPDNRKINSASYSNRQRSLRWTYADTELFYDGLRQFGTDFELISRMFIGRTRRNIKSKWTREERLNPGRITEALSNKKSVDIDYYGRMTSLDLVNSDKIPADPMTRFYEGLPTMNVGIKLESNRPPSAEPDDRHVEEDNPQHEEGQVGSLLFQPPSDTEGSERDTGEYLHNNEGSAEQSPEPQETVDQDEEEEPFDFASMGGMQVKVSL